MANETFINHFIKTREDLLAFSKHLDIVNHGDIKGLAREAITTQFLNTNLPSLVEYKTGEIIDYENQKSGQVDIILQSVTSPKIHLHNNLQISLADAVIAVIEVKSNLTTASFDNESHLKSAFISFQKIKRLKRFYKLDGLNESHENHKNTPCILFAFSGPLPNTLIKKYIEYHKNFNIGFDDFAPDLTIVLDKGYAIHRNNGWIGPIDGDQPFLFRDNKEKCLIPFFVYLCKMIEVWNMKVKHTRFQDYF